MADPDRAPGRDPLDALRAAWADLPAPPPARELSEEDAVTRSIVGWLGGAWRQPGVLDLGRAPALRAPVALRARQRRLAPARPAAFPSLPAWGRPLAAAALLLLLLGGGWWLEGRWRDGAAPVGPAPPHQPAGIAGTHPGVFPGAVAAAGAACPPIARSSGPVHLLLFTDSSLPAPEIPR